MLSGEATNTNFIVFGLTRSRLEPTIYRTRSEHANQYSTDAVWHKYIISMFCDAKKLQHYTGLVYTYPITLIGTCIEGTLEWYCTTSKKFKRFKVRTLCNQTMCYKTFLFTNDNSVTTTELYRNKYYIYMTLNKIIHGSHKERLCKPHL